MSESKSTATNRDALHSPPSVGVNDWRNKAHRFDDLPADIQGQVRAQVSLTAVASAILLPENKLSVLDLISVFVPHHSPSERDYAAPINHQYFSTQDCVSDMELISSITVPPRSIVSTLLSSLTQKWIDGANSIHIPGQQRYLPMWVVSFWSALYLTVIPRRINWCCSIEWLLSLSTTHPAEVKTTLDCLSLLPWSGSIKAAGNRSQSTYSTESLTRFLSWEWLGDEQVDQMVWLLQQQLQEKSPSREIFLLDTIHIRAILLAFHGHQDDTSPYDVNGTSFLHRLGSQLTPTSSLGGIFHVNGNHWIAVAVDLMQEAVVFGDPMDPQGLPNDEILDSLRWFVSMHVPGFSLDQLDFERMPTPRQDLSNDRVNCAIFSYSALQHFFLPDSTQLMGTSRSEAEVARLVHLRSLVGHHLSQLSAFEKALPLTRFKYPSFTSSSSQAAKRTHDNDPLLPQPPARKVKLNVTALPSQKRKIKKSVPTSVIAPVFKLKKKQTVEDLRKRCKVSKEIPIDPMLNVPEDLVSGDDRSNGRPRSEVLDHLTVEIQLKGGIRQYRCAGTGCPTTWAPRSLSRVLKHCKGCLQMTSEQRRYASAASSNKSPGAVVATLSTQQSRTSSSPSLSPSSSFSDSSSAVVPIRTSDPVAFFGPRGRKETHARLDLAIVKFFCVAGIATNVADLEEWKDIFSITSPSYRCASRTTLMDSHIMSEQEHCRREVIGYLKTKSNLTITFDGGDTRAGDAFYTANVTTPERETFLIAAQECTRDIHTGAWIADFVERSMDEIGKDRFTSMSSDSTGNTNLGRDILETENPVLLNLPDPMHHLNNTCKDIGSLPYFKPMIKGTRALVKHFKISKPSKARLKDLRTRSGTGPGLESFSKTRFSGTTWVLVSVQRNLPHIRELVTSELVNIPKYNEMFGRSPTSLHYEIHITQYLAVTLPIAKAIQCLEAASSNAGDVYLYWCAITAQIKHALETCGLPEDVKSSIRGIIVSRWRGMFVNGSTNAHLCAFYMHPSYVRSSIFKNPNPLTFNITLPGKTTAKMVPPGIKSPKTFLEVGSYMHELGVIEVNHGVNPVLTAYKNRPKAFTRAYKAQFTAYAQQSYPFNVPIANGQDPLNYWLGFADVSNAEILAAICIKLFSATPNSMADERVMSAVTMMNTARRNRLSVEALTAMIHVREYYRYQKNSKVRKSSRPRPILKFYDIKRLLRLIDEDEGGVIDDNELSDTEDESCEDESNEPPTVDSNYAAPSEHLPIGDDDEIDVTALELHDILADAPVVRCSRTESATDAHSKMVVMEEVEEGGSFELDDWV